MRPELSTDDNLIYCGYKGIIDAVLKCGAVPIGIFPPNIDNYYQNDIKTTKVLTSEEKQNLINNIEEMDGIICQGGDDLYEYDVETIKYCYQTKKPLLGICLGMQAMAYTFNGKLGDIGNLSHKQKGVKYAHSINIKEGSLLYEIFNTSNISVNSRHKSCVMSTDLEITAFSNDLVIEAIEGKNHPFFIGVQWHPETMIEYDIMMNRLFTYFIQTCKLGE
ncbi:MAG: gamma-glutamyl-gamma-aminobutyrate hydrolase family protein [Bacilli bacterium]|nr:gamma-glutamyl-gamma-aminobutyrate hydrolase family protein [Bacilli bacterium]